MEHKKMLLHIARQSIAHGLQTSSPLPVKAEEYTSDFQEIRATFVTLHREGRLRACMGVLEAFRPLVVDVAQNAYAAAFEDPRFPPLTLSELPHLEIAISILSASEPLAFSSEEDLLQKIRPGVDGLLLKEGIRRGTFLPAVWEDLPRPQDFLRHLKLKAGLPENYWSPSIQVSRYTVEEIKEEGKTV